MKPPLPLLLLLLAWAALAPPAGAVYNPETGTFMTVDPAGDVDGPNAWAYVKQNPWSMFDPEGLWADSYDDWECSAQDSAAQGGVWGWSKYLGVELAKNTLNTLSLGNFRRNSTIAGQVASGKISAADGELAVEGNTLVGVASVGAGSVAGKTVGGIGAGAAAAFTQSATQVLGQHAIAGVTGTPQTSLSSDLTQVATTTVIGGAFDAAGAIGQAVALNQAAKATRAQSRRALPWRSSLHPAAAPPPHRPR